MTTLRSILACALLAVGIVLLVCVALLVRSATAVVDAVPFQVEAARAGALAELAAIHRDTLALVDHQATVLRADATGQIRDLRTETLARVDALTVRTDARVGQALQVADSRMGEATGAIVGLRQDLRPTLEATAALEADAQASIDDLYPDLKASVESGAVTMHSVALASEAIEAAAPKLADSATGVAADVRREADEMTAPKKWWAKLLGPIYTVGRLVAAFL